MAFESLSDKLQNIFKNLRGKGRLSEADVKAALKEVKMALLEVDASFKAVKQFISSIPGKSRRGRGIWKPDTQDRFDGYQDRNRRTGKADGFWKPQK